MVANITVTDKSQEMFFIASNGRRIRLADGKMFSREPHWHRLGMVIPEGLSFIEGIKYLDHDGNFEPYISPMVRFHNGEIVYTQYGEIVRPADPNGDSDFPIVYGNPVRIGDMTDEKWTELNPEVTNGQWQVSEKYEVLSPRTAMQIIHDNVRDMDNKPLVAESMGFLGAHGVDGLFATVEMPSWQKSILEALGTDVANYMSFFLDYKSGLFYAYLSNIIAVCQNTVIMGMGSAVTLLKTGTEPGVKDRFTKVISGVYEGGLDVVERSEDEVAMLLDTSYNDDDVDKIAEIIYPDAAKAVKTRVYNTTYSERKKRAEDRQDLVDAHREAFKTLVKNKTHYEEAGVTPQMEGTLMVPMQVGTFLATHSPNRGQIDTYVRDMFVGRRRKQLINTYDAVMTVADPDYKAVDELDILQHI